MFSTFIFPLGFSLVVTCAGAPATGSSSSSSSASSSSSSSSSSSTTNLSNSSSGSPPAGGGGTPGGSNTTSGADPAFIRGVLDVHNGYRRRYRADNLAWAADLYQGVSAQAQTCSSIRTNGPYGENLFASTNLNATCVDAVNFWMAESDADPGFSQNTRDFTQVVWRSTRSVACALSSCPSGTIFPNQPAKFCACHYSPPGNIQGRYRQNVGRPRRGSPGSSDPWGTDDDDWDHFDHHHGDFDHDGSDSGNWDHDFRDSPSET
ncbi:PR-1-like protein [Pluteus cervinus]|uniref:PR-1-like protein n=1 Tax=Pluteus cervinus TaxID=181527 RepID=A0ACD3AKD5_9AGAR|nr:PR-1-like protein [Pluteus cervinus]